MIARFAAGAGGIGLVLVACARIDPPADYTKPEAGTNEAPAGAPAYERCRLLERRFVTNVQARVYGEAPGPQAVCVTLDLPLPGELVFCVAGALQNVEVPSNHELTADLQQCAYCTYLETSCVVAEAGATPACSHSYAPITGKARIVRFGKKPGDAVWIDIGDLEVARVTRRDETRIDLERRDCIFADGLTLQGVLERGSANACTGVEEPACRIANTAGSRFP